jgi:hypothetical protein
LVLVVLTDHSAFGSRAIGVGDGRPRLAEHSGDFYMSSSRTSSARSAGDSRSTMLRDARR